MSKDLICKRRKKNLILMKLLCVLALIIFVKIYNFTCSASEIEAEKKEPENVIGRYYDSVSEEYVYESIDISLVGLQTDEFPEVYVKKGSEKISFLYYPRSKDVSHKTIREYEFVQYDYLRKATGNQGDGGDISWGVARIGADVFAEKMSAERNEIIVAVIDTGIDDVHRLFQDRIVDGYDFVDQDTDPMDQYGHGTHVAGIIAQSTFDNVKIMPIRVLDSKGYGKDLDIRAGIIYAVDHGADIINLSLGGPGFSPLMEEAVEYALDNGVLVVAAAGNEGADTENFSPAGFKNIIVVAASDEGDNLAEFSNYGESIDLTAPGVDILSSFFMLKYAYASGTSMAAPFVSAGAALILSDDSNRSIYEVENLLKIHTDDRGEAGWDEAYGEGILNLSRFSDREIEFEVVSPCGMDSWYETVTIKTVINNHIGDNIAYYIDGTLVEIDVIDKNGLITKVLSLEDYQYGSHELMVEIMESEDSNLSRIIPINIEEYNITFQILDINNEPVPFYQLWIYGINGGTCNIIEPESFFRTIDGMTYTYLDLAQLKKEYKNIIVAATKQNNPDVPVYIRQLITTGDQIYTPSQLQKVTFSASHRELDEERVYGRIRSYFANIIFMVDDSYIADAGLGLMKSYLIDYSRPDDVAVVYVDEGKHKICMSGEQWSSLVTLEGKGETTYENNGENSGRINYFGDEGSLNDSSDSNNGVSYYLKKIGKPSLYAMGLVNVLKGENIWYQGYGKYLLMSQRKVDGETINFFKLITIDDSHKEIEQQLGGTLRNSFVLDYTSDSLNGTVNVEDSYGNLLVCNNGTSEGNHYIPGGRNALGESWEAPIIYDPESFIVYQPQIYLESIYDKSRYSATFEGFNSFSFGTTEIPDGDYTLKFRYGSKVYSQEFTDLDVVVEGGKYLLDEVNIGPMLSYSGNLNKTVELYSRFELNLEELFIDMEGDHLHYLTNYGYIINNTLYYEANSLGLRDFKIKCSDWRGGRAVAEFSILVTEEGIRFENPFEKPFTKIVDEKLSGVSEWAKPEIRKALEYGLIEEKHLKDYDKNINREEFCEMIVRLYEQITEKNVDINFSNRFMDTDNPSVLKAYSLRIVNGYSSDKFGSYDPIIRQDMAVMVNNTLEAAFGTKLDGEGSLFGYHDTNSISEYAIEDVEYCVDRGLITGYNYHFNPRGFTTKEQAIAIITRVFERYKF